MFNAEFLITSLVVVLIPGTGVIYTVSTGLFLGWRASIAAAFGCTAGIIPHLSASILGLSAILHVSAVAFQIVKYAGAVYLTHISTGSDQDNMLKLLYFSSKTGPFSALEPTFWHLKDSFKNQGGSIFSTPSIAILF